MWPLLYSYVVLSIVVSSQAHDQAYEPNFSSGSLLRRSGPPPTCESSDCLVSNRTACCPNAVCVPDAPGKPSFFENPATGTCKPPCKGSPCDLRKNSADCCPGTFCYTIDDEDQPNAGACQLTQFSCAGNECELYQGESEGCCGGARCDTTIDGGKATCKECDDTGEFCSANSCCDGKFCNVESDPRSFSGFKRVCRKCVPEGNTTDPTAPDSQCCFGTINLPFDPKKTDSPKVCRCANKDEECQVGSCCGTNSCLSTSGGIHLVNGAIDNERGTCTCRPKDFACDLNLSDGQCCPGNLCLYQNGDSGPVVCRCAQKAEICQGTAPDTPSTCCDATTSCGDTELVLAAPKGTGRCYSCRQGAATAAKSESCVGGGIPCCKKQGCAAADRKTLVAKGAPGTCAFCRYLGQACVTGGVQCCNADAKCISTGLLGLAGKKCCCEFSS